MSVSVDSSPKLIAFALSLVLPFAIFFFPMSPISASNSESEPFFGGDLETIVEGAYVNYTLQNGEWFFWEVVTIFPNNTALVIQINQTASNRLISFLTVSMDNPAILYFYLWTQTKTFRPGDAGIAIANGSADVVSDVIVSVSKNDTIVPLRAYRLVVTSGPYKGYVLHYEATTGILLEYYISSEESLPFMQISDTNLHLALPQSEDNGLSFSDMVELGLSASLFLGSILMIFFLTHYKLSKKGAETRKSD